MDTEPLVGKTVERNLKSRSKKKPFKRKLKLTLEKVMKFAEKNLALSESRKPGSSRMAVNKIGSAEEFCDQVGIFRDEL